MTAASPPTGVKAWIRGILPESARETFYRVSAGVLTFLTGFGVLDNDKGALWGQLAVGTITAVFALLYATTGARVVLYSLVGPIGGVLLAYGLINDVRWAVITASIGQIFGVVTAASKTVELVPSGLTGVSGLTSGVETKQVVSVRSPREARAVRKSRSVPRSPAKARRDTRAK